MANTLRENVLLAAPPQRDKRVVYVSGLDCNGISIKCR